MTSLRRKAARSRKARESVSVVLRQIRRVDKGVSFYLSYGKLGKTRETNHGIDSRERHSSEERKLVRVEYQTPRES